VLGVKSRIAIDGVGTIMRCLSRISVGAVLLTALVEYNAFAGTESRLIQRPAAKADL
jgi:hypothetical protein